MSEQTPSPIEDMLQAFVDDVLPEERHAEVEAYLAGHPAEAERIEAYRQQNSGLQNLRGLLATGDFEFQQPAAQRSRLRPVLWAAAAVVLLSIGLLGGWTLRGWLPGAQLASSETVPLQAAYAHRTYTPEVIHPVEVAAVNQQHLVKWLSKRLGAKVHAPQLTLLGFDLVGGRLLPTEAGPAGQFMYQNKAMNRLTLYVVSSEAGRQETAFRYLQKGTLGVFYWLDDHMDYALAGEIDRENLLRIATEVYRQLERN